MAESLEVIDSKFESYLPLKQLTLESYVPLKRPTITSDVLKVGRSNGRYHVTPWDSFARSNKKGEKMVGLLWMKWKWWVFIFFHNYPQKKLT